MVAIKARFDGEKIIPPPELIGQPPRDVLVLVDEPSAVAQDHSVFDYLGHASVLRSAEDIAAQVRREREEWGDR